MNEWNLSEKEKEWVIKVVSMDKTRLEVTKKLLSSEYPEEKTDEMIRFFDWCMEIKREEEEIRRLQDEKRDGNLFETNVRKFFSENRNELSFGEKREIKKWIKNINSYSNTLKMAIKNLKKEIDLINKKDWNTEKVNKELKNLKLEIIDRIIESKSIVEIEHPITKEEVTKENLMELELDELIKLMEENVETLDLVVNGKITED